MKKIISLFTGLILNSPILSLLFLCILLFGSYQQISNLSINSNQIDLLPSEYPEVVQTKRVVDMIGGNGFFIIVLKSKDEKGMNDHLQMAFLHKRNGNQELYLQELENAHKTKEQNPDYYKKLESELKSTADKLNERLLQEKTVRYISYRYDTDFLQERLPLLMHSEDLLEVQKRVQKKIELEKNKLNPFYINVEEEEITFTDILQKYQRLAKRDIFDEYNISSDKTMLIMLVKPTGSFTDVGFTRDFEKQVESIVQEMKIRDDGTFVGYTGTYKLNLDDYDTLVNALKPVSIASLLGIIILLLLFFRNPIFILILTLSLVTGVLITFGLTGFFIGRLNTITSILAAVLMGLGIDYGIQFLYRFRQEFTLREDLRSSVEETIYHTGLASLISALTTTSAFVVLMFSDFRGFSEFGLIACYGIITIALSMYFVTAIQIAIVLKYFPSLKKTFFHDPPSETEITFLHNLFANPNKVLSITAVVILVSAILSYRVQFNYSGRDLLLEDQESLLLYDEIADRFDVSSDPQVIVVDTMEETEGIFDYFNPVPDSIKDSIDQIVSVWSMIPPTHQQKINLHILSNIYNDVKAIPKSVLSEEQKKHYPKVMKYFEVKEYGLDELPEFLQRPFKEVPESKTKGYMLFVYPKVALWHGKDLMKFYDAVGHFEYPVISKRTINLLLHTTEQDYSKKENLSNYSKLEFTKEELQIILDKSNTLSQEDLVELGVLPGTADFLVQNRPYSSLADLRKHKKKAGTVGSVILFAKLAQIVQSEGYTSIFFTLAIVTIILIVFYRGVMPAIMSLVPLLLGIVLMLGIMGLTNTKVNFMNILVFPIIIGYGIQNGIYIYFRFLEEKEIGRTLAQVGPAVIASTLTTLVGWSTLLLAQHRGLKSIGILASIGIGATLIVAIFVLPSILEKYLDTTSNQKDTRVREMGMNFDSALEVESNENFYEDLLETQNEDLQEFPLQAEEQTTTPKISKKKSKKTTSKKKSISKKKDQNQNHE